MNIHFKKGHVNSLDGIRGIAILLVLFFHCFENIPVFPVNYISELGWVGVDLFFVLSGFLITGILVDTKERENYLTSFFAKRALRIFPLYYLTLTLFFLALKIPGLASINPVFDTRHYQSSIYYFTFTQNLFFAFNGWGVTDILNHFWSLAVEEQFYLIWPFVIYYTSRPKVLVICMLLVVVSLVTRNLNADSDFSYVFTLARVDALGIGAMIAIVIRDHGRLLNKLILPVFFSSLICLAFMIFNSEHLSFRNQYFVRAGYTIFALLFASIIAFVYDQTKIGQFTRSVLSLKPLLFFGTYSYGIYIYHWLLYKGVYVHLQNKYHFSRIFILPFLGVVVVISVLSFHCYEKYFLSFKTKFDTKKKAGTEPATIKI
jgi:peptidoglycan/LPS O-acetylase OafA/YrhL